MTRKWWTLGAVVIATFMLLLDITVVNTALPKLEQSLGASFTDLQWVVDIYSLTLATVVLTAGSLADRLGRKRSFLVGLLVFSAASLACALAPSARLSDRRPRGTGHRRRDHVRALAGARRAGVPRRAASAGPRWPSMAPRSAWPWRSDR